MNLIIGKNYQSRLLVGIDKKLQHIKTLLIKSLMGKNLKTITFDNDQAFSLHHEIAKELSMKTFFVNPLYFSGQRHQ